MALIKEVTLNELNLLYQRLSLPGDELNPFVQELKTKINRSIERTQRNEELTSSYMQHPENFHKTLGELLSIPEYNQLKTIEEVLNTTSIITVKFRTRILNALHGYNILLIADLLQYTPRQIHYMRNMGDSSIQLLANVLTRLQEHHIE